MPISESQFIHERCLRMIREASMAEESWRYTLLDQLHHSINSLVKIEDEELPLFSVFVDDLNWTVGTTHNFFCSLRRKKRKIQPSQFGSTVFGDFKQDLANPRPSHATLKCGWREVKFLYESGTASMPPIHYFKFWSLKWPVWKETYRVDHGDTGAI